MNERTTGTPPPTDTSVRGALRQFFHEAKNVPAQVVIVFLAVAVFGILSRYFGSRVFFRELFYVELSGDRLYILYEYLYWFASEAVWFFILPVLTILILHRKPLRSFGLGAGDWRFGLKISLIFYLIMLPIVWVASASAEFQSVYPHAQLTKADWNLLLIYELGLLVYFIGWEFIWRGYMLFGLKDYTGPAIAVLIQMIPFVVMHYGKPLPETLGSVIAAIALGALALRVRSFWYCVVIHWTVMFTIDVFSTLRFRGGIEGYGFDAIGQLLRYVFS